MDLVNKAITKYVSKNREKASINNILDFLKLLGLNVVIKENINNFELGIDLEHILESFLNEKPIVEFRVDGQIIIRNDNCMSYLSEENRLIKPINVKIIINKGNLSIKTSYISNLYDDGTTKKVNNYDICVLNTGHTKCMTSKYVLNEKRSYRYRDYIGNGYVTLSEYTIGLNRIYRHDIFFSNKPVVKELETANAEKELSNIVENDINVKLLELKDLSKGIVNWGHSDYVNSELIIYNDLNKRQTAVYKNKDDEEIILTKKLTK